MKEDKKKYFYERPKLIDRPQCKDYNPEMGCLYCRNKTFRFYSSFDGKKYYQCEKCRGINH